MFMDTLQSPFYEHMLGSVSSNFADVVIVGERIELGLKTGKIAQGSIATSKKFGFNPGKKKENDGQVASTTVHYPSTNYKANTIQGNQQSVQPNWKNEMGSNSYPTQGQNSFQRRDQVQFTPIPMTYTDLLPTLLQRAMVAICPMKPLQPPYPKFYDSNARCDYHGGAVGHSIENCRAFKFKVQSLIDSGWLTFQENKPNVEKNPLSGRAGPSTNAVISEEGQGLIRSVENMKSSLKDIFSLICQMGYFKLINCSEDSCGFHADNDHSIEECSEFKSFLQDLMDRHMLQIWHQRKEEEVFAQIGEESNIPRPKPLVIHFTRESVAPVEVHPVVIQVPSPFPYKNDKAVPWKYGISVLNSSSCEKQENEATDIDKTTVDNILGLEE